MPVRLHESTLDAQSRARAAFEWYLRSGQTGSIQVNPVTNRFSVSLDDAAFVRDVLTVISGINVTLGDAIAVTELLSVYMPADLHPMLSDSVTPTEDLVALLTIGYGLADAVVTSENLATSLRAMATLSDNVSPSEQLLVSSPGEAVLADTLHALESLSVRLRMMGALDDSVTVAEDLQASLRESNLLEDTLVGFSDSIVVALTMNAAFAESSYIGETIQVSHRVLPRQWHVHLADTATPTESLDAGGHFSASLSDTALPSSPPLTTRLRMHTGQLFTNSVADSVGTLPPLRRNQLYMGATVGLPVKSALIETSADPVDNTLPYDAFRASSFGTAQGQILQRGNTARIWEGLPNAADFTLGRIRMYTGGLLGNDSNCGVIINRDTAAGTTGLLSTVFVANTNIIVLANEFGDELWLGNTRTSPARQVIPLNQEGGSFLRFISSQASTRNYLTRFIERLGLSRRLLFAWYQPDPGAAVQFVTRTGLSDRIEVRYAMQSVALSDTAVPTESLIADTQLTSTLADVATPMESLAVGGQFSADLSDSTSPVDAITHTSVQTFRHHYTNVLADTATPTESLDAGGHFSASLSDTAAPSDGPLVAHILPPARHGAQISDIIVPSENLFAHIVDGLNTSAINRRALN